MAHLLAQHNVAHFVVLRVQIDRRRFHGHHFRGGAYLQPQGGRRHRSDVHFHILLRQRLEPFLCRTDGVASDRQGEKAEIALRVRGGLAHSSGSLVSQRQGAAWKHSTALVSDRSVDIAGGLLGKRQRQKCD